MEIFILPGMMGIQTKPAIRYMQRMLLNYTSASLINNISIKGKHVIQLQAFFVSMPAMVKITI